MNNFPRYQNKEIKATKNAAEELWQCRNDLWDVIEILDAGHDCSSSKRKANIIERCVKKGNKVLKAVVVDLHTYFLIIHFGKFTYKKR